MFFFFNIIMTKLLFLIISNHFNRWELLQKAKDRYHNCGCEENATKAFITNEVKKTTEYY